MRAVDRMNGDRCLDLSLTSCPDGACMEETSAYHLPNNLIKNNLRTDH